MPQPFSRVAEPFARRSSKCWRPRRPEPKSVSRDDAAEKSRTRKRCERNERTDLGGGALLDDTAEIIAAPGCGGGEDNPEQPLRVFLPEVLYFLSNTILF
jgi:hypothetical protein